MKTEAEQDWIDKAFTQFICYITTTSSWEAQKSFRKAIIDNLPTKVEISKKELKAHCIWDEHWIVYWAVCLLLLNKWIKLSE